MIFGKKVPTALVDPKDALPGRTDQTMPVPEKHHVLGTPLVGPWPAGHEVAVLGMGCFWGAERLFWQLPGVHSTAVGYAGGFTPNCTYEENCTGLTGHAEVFFVVFDPSVISFDDLLRVFWENHDPTQGMRQGNDSAAIGSTPSCARSISIPSPPNWRSRDPSSMPRTTTSSTSPGTPTGTAAWAAPA